MTDDSSTPSGALPVFYPVPTLKVVLFTVLSGGYYIYYWMYRSWRAYRTANGYAAKPFWQVVTKRTGYRPSPFWRALLWHYYAIALFPAIDRECRLRGRKLPIPPGALAIIAALGLLASGQFAGATILSALALLPIQMAVNHVNPEASGGRWGLQPVEGILVVLGALLYWVNL